MKKVTKHVFETSDGKAFDVKAEAEKHECYIALEKFFEAHLSYDDEDGPGQADTASAVVDNLDAFAEIIRPLIRKPRAAKAEAQADDYEAAMDGAAKPAKSKAA